MPTIKIKLLRLSTTSSPASNSTSVSSGAKSIPYITATGTVTDLATVAADTPLPSVELNSENFIDARSWNERCRSADSFGWYKTRSRVKQICNDNQSEYQSSFFRAGFFLGLSFCFFFRFSVCDCVSFSSPITTAAKAKIAPHHFSRTEIGWIEVQGGIVHWGRGCWEGESSGKEDCLECEFFFSSGPLTGSLFWFLGLFWWRL